VRRRLRSQPDATFDKTPRRASVATPGHGVKSKEINAQRYAAGSKPPMGANSGQGIH